MSVASDEQRQEGNVRGNRVLWPPRKIGCGDGGSEKVKLRLVAMQPRSNNHTRATLFSLMY